LYPGPEGILGSTRRDLLPTVFPTIFLSIGGELRKSREKAKKKKLIY
jgi:hypothetical protein